MIFCVKKRVALNYKKKEAVKNITASFFKILKAINNQGFALAYQPQRQFDLEVLDKAHFYPR